MAKITASDRLSSLLILPPPPSPATAAALKAAYQPSITATLQHLSSLKLADTAVLEILLPCPGALYQLQEPRSQLFETAQRLLAGVYSLICAVCAQDSILPDGAGGVDYRIILLAHDEKGTFNYDKSHSHDLTGCGPIVDMPTFALTRRKWRYMYPVDGEAGEHIFAHYTSLARTQNPPIQGDNHSVPGGISLVSTSPKSHSSKTAVTHSVVAVGGTFDHLHAGHKLLLTSTALLLQPSSGINGRYGRMIVGITGDELLKNKKYAEFLGSWKEREESVVDFLTSILCFSLPGKEVVDTVSFNEPVVNGRAIHTKFKNEAINIECVEIQDAFGPTITDESVSALVVSGETRSGGAAVNTKRQEKGWKTLEVFEVDVLDASDEDKSASGTEEFAAKISSTAIRKLMFEKGSS